MQYMLLLANGALRVVGDILMTGVHVQMRQTIQNLFTDYLTIYLNTRPVFCSSTHAPGHPHHHHC